MKRSIFAVAPVGRPAMLAALVLVVTVSAIAGWSPASARAAVVFSVPGAAGAGPARYDRVLVQRFGPASARTVLVLVPGKTSGAGVFSFIAADLVKRVRGLQVWAVDRREQAFEDTSVIAAGEPDQALAYYLRGQPVGGRLFSPPPVSEVGFMAKWGLGLLVADLRRVVRRARAGGRRVILGGHSMGASVAEAYASWDFAGRAGYRDLAGLVLIDGGLPLAPSSLTPAQARAILALIRTEGPRLDVLNQRRPYLYGVLSAVAGLYADKQPQRRSPLDTVTPSLPFQPPFPATNQTWLGLASQFFYPPTGEALAHAGHPAAGGDPRPWIDGDITPVARLARLLTQTPINSVDWYIPRRLVELDIRAAEPLATTSLTRLLGLRLTHRAEIRLPLYAFQTASGPAVLHGARRFARASRIRRPTLVADPTMVHFDPLTALPTRNSFLRSVTPFLRRVAANTRTPDLPRIGKQELAPHRRTGVPVSADRRDVSARGDDIARLVREPATRLRSTDSAVAFCAGQDPAARPTQNHACTGTRAARLVRDWHSCFPARASLFARAPGMPALDEQQS